jgi:hypothetical protein
VSRKAPHRVINRRSNACLEQEVVVEPREPRIGAERARSRLGVRSNTRSAKLFFRSPSRSVPWAGFPEFRRSTRPIRVEIERALPCRPRHGSRIMDLQRRMRSVLALQETSSDSRLLELRSQDHVVGQ